MSCVSKFQYVLCEFRQRAGRGRQSRLVVYGVSWREKGFIISRGKAVQGIEYQSLTRIASLPSSSQNKAMQLNISRNGYPEYVIATCEDCDHAWRLRGVSQVDPEWFSRR